MKRLLILPFAIVFALSLAAQQPEWCKKLPRTAYVPPKSAPASGVLVGHRIAPLSSE